METQLIRGIVFTLSLKRTREICATVNEKEEDTQGIEIIKKARQCCDEQITVRSPLSLEYNQDVEMAEEAGLPMPPPAQ